MRSRKLARATREAWLSAYWYAYGRGQSGRAAEQFADEHSATVAVALIGGGTPPAITEHYTNWKREQQP